MHLNSGIKRTERIKNLIVEWDNINGEIDSIDIRAPTSASGTKNEMKQIKWFKILPQAPPDPDSYRDREGLGVLILVLLEELKQIGI